MPRDSYFKEDAVRYDCYAVKEPDPVEETPCKAKKESVECFVSQMVLPMLAQKLERRPGVFGGRSQ